MAAGIGSRYGGFKQIDPIGPHGETLLDYSLYDAITAGFHRFIFVVSQDIKNTLKRTLDATIGQRYEMEFVLQELELIPSHVSLPPGRVKPWGTGHAVLSCKPYIQGPFAVINADDYYGRNSFHALSDFIKSRIDQPESTEYCMVVFSLENTLTQHGHVARAICTINNDGYLEGVREQTHIERKGATIKALHPDGTSEQLAAKLPVSMNMWGFNRSLFSELEDQFVTFMKAANTDLITAEFFLPEVVNHLLVNEKATVRALSTDENWFGITHREDKHRAELEIGSRIQAGVYPEFLWGER